MSRAAGLVLILGASGVAFYMLRDQQQRQLEAEKAAYEAQLVASRDNGDWWQNYGQQQNSTQSLLAGLASPFIQEGIGALGQILNRNSTSAGDRSAPKWWSNIFGGNDAARPTAAPQTRQTLGAGVSGPYNASGTGPGGVDFDAHEARYNLPGGYLRRTAEIESSMNPNAQNPRSSAGGLYQFINATARDYGLTDRFDPVQATDAASRLARDNAARLRTVLGREPTGAELYLAHQQGGGGASKLLRDPNAPATSIVGSAAVKLNGGNASMTAGEFANLWIDKFNRGRG